VETHTGAGVRVIAIRRAGGVIVTAPAGDALLAAGDVLISIGDQGRQLRMEERASPEWVAEAETGRNPDRQAG
jgi:uncharacterized protein with PhoU and TrkA domain